MSNVALLHPERLGVALPYIGSGAFLEHEQILKLYDHLVREIAVMVVYADKFSVLVV